MNFCSDCGARVSRKIPPGDNVPRWVCDSCHTIHYQNPKVVVGCVPEWEGRRLLCRRAIEPRYGYWTLPAGFMENGETTADGLFTLQQSECLGACADSPVLLVNDRQMCSFMSTERLDELIDALKKA